MKTPTQYQHQLAEIHIEDASSQEALEALTTQLKEIEASLIRDLHALQMQYQGRVSSMHIPTPRKHPNKERVEDEQRTLEERQGKLAPYEDLKLKVQGLLAQATEKRESLEKAG
jgi:hypothetical protein